MNISMMTYKKYSQINIDSSPIGLELCGNENSCFCTPEGAKIIGCAGVDGIHYCFVRGFGEMVFVVNPMNSPENHVHPLAKDFRGFLRLLLACGNTTALNQAYFMDQSQFDALLKGNPPSDEQQAVLDTIRRTLNLTPMEEPFEYIKELQAEFDYNSIKFSEWKVYFDGNFWGHHGRERAGKEIFIRKQFTWGETVWYIPTIYACSKGLVIDFCVQIPVECIRAFMEKWSLAIESDVSDFTNEKVMKIEAENPMSIRMNPEIVLNDKIISASHGSILYWNPLFPEREGFEAKGVIEQYGLDSTCGWAICRYSFPWATKRKPSISTLTVSLKQDPVAIPGPHFHASAPGDCIEFTYPETDVLHELIVQEYEPQKMTMNHFGDNNYEFPTHYIAMSYILSPDLPDNTFTVSDCLSSDSPRQKHANSNQSHSSASCSAIGVIGGAHGPVAIFVGGNNQGKLRMACSALHFDPVDDVEWQMVFYKKTCEDITVTLL